MDTIHGFTRACIVTPFLSKVKSDFSAKNIPNKGKQQQAGDLPKQICKVLILISITKVLNVHDPMIGMMGALSWVTSFMVWALATQGWMMYLATGLSSIGVILMLTLMMIILKILGHIFRTRKTF